MSQSYKEMEEELRVTPEQREEHFEVTGEYVTDETIQRKLQHTTDGTKTDFYNIGDSQDVDDLAEHWDLRGDEFNCLKALVGIAKGARHNGTSPIRDANKLVHYAQRIQRRLNKQQG